MPGIGFIGTGTITQHMVRGLKASALAEMQIILSPRNPAVAQELSEALPGVQIAADNQDVLDRADLIVLAVRPQVAAEVIRPLTFARHKPVISLIATLPIAQIHGWTAASQICRAIPLPFVERRTGVTPVFPPLPEAMRLFEALGQALAVTDSAAFDSYAAASATMGTYFGLVESAGIWMQAQGIAEPDASVYLRALFADLGMTLLNHPQSPAELRIAHSTRGGLNEQLYRVFQTSGGSAALNAGLSAVLARISDRPAGR